MQALPSLKVCRLNWIVNRAQDKRFHRASLSRLCYGGNAIVSLQKYNCAPSLSKRNADFLALRNTTSASVEMQSRILWAGLQ